MRALQRELWFSIRRATGILDDMNADSQEVLRAVNALSVASNAYLRALEAGEMHEQLQELWAAHQAQQGKLP